MTFNADNPPAPQDDSKRFSKGGEKKLPPLVVKGLKGPLISDEFQAFLTPLSRAHYQIFC